MPFAPECFWAFETRATFWAIFWKIFLAPPFALFSEKAGFGWPCLNCDNWAIRALLDPFSAPESSPVFSLEVHTNYSRKPFAFRVLLGLSREGYFLGDFWKISLGPPFVLFQKSAGFGWPCQNCHNLAIRALLEPLFAPKCFPVFAV